MNGKGKNAFLSRSFPVSVFPLSFHGTCLIWGWRESATRNDMRMATWRRALAGPGLDHPWIALVDRDQSEWCLESIDELGNLVITQKQIVP